MKNAGGGYYGWSPVLPAYLIYPYSAQEQVNSNLDWDAAEALFGYYFYQSSGGYGYGGGAESDGLWNGISERFAALRFSLNGSIHYGWVRCSVAPNYEGIIVHDYAYNDSTEMGIATGATFDEDLVAQSIAAADVDNNKNGLDLNVQFDKANNEKGISEYRVIAVKSSIADNFSVTNANSTSHYKSVIPSDDTGAQPISVNLNEFSKDSDGDLIVENVPYKIFVLSTPDLVNMYNSNLSLPSNEVTLTSNLSLNESLFENVLISTDQNIVNISSEKIIKSIQINDINGRLVNNVNNVSNYSFESKIEGIFIVTIEQDNKFESKKIIL